MTHDEMITVIQADKDGATVQRMARTLRNKPWELHLGEWNFEAYIYRIKPEPFERWLVVDEDDDVVIIVEKESVATSRAKMDCDLRVIHMRQVD